MSTADELQPRRLRPSRQSPALTLSPRTSGSGSLGLASPPSVTSPAGGGGGHAYSSFAIPGPSTAGAGAGAGGGAGKDVFGDVTASPVAKGTPRAGGTGMRATGAGGTDGAGARMSGMVPSPASAPRSGRKGKEIMRDYGDRFIPTRDGTNLHAAYQLMPDTLALSRDAQGRRRKSNVGQASDVEARREEVNATYSQLLKEELFSPSRSPSRTASPAHAYHPRPSSSRHAQLRRPPVTALDNSHIQNLPGSRYPTSSAGTTPLHHYPPSAVTGIIIDSDRRERELSPASTLPPLPLHAPATPNSSHAHDTTPGAGPSSAHHRAHQSQVALSGPSRSTGGGGPSPPHSQSHSHSSPHGNGYARAHSGSSMYGNDRMPLSPPSYHPDEPGTPSKKRLLNFASSPASHRMAALTSGLDNMEHERYSLSPVGRRSQEVLLSPRKGVRTISRTPFKVLDAPELADDFYLNLVSWSASNVLGVGLNSCVYLWSAQTSKVTKLCDMAALSGTGEEVNDAVTGLEWTNKGSTLAIGTSRGTVEIWDAEHCKKLRTMTGHTGRVGSLAWNSHILSTGSRDRTILHRDVRVPDHYIRKLSGHHKQEVCGLKWNTQTDQLASGGNDNKLYIWSATDARPTWRFGEHRAAVKAIAWSPHQRGVLASGGGTADKKIRFWNSQTGGLVSEWDTGSQVCNLMWSLNSNELVSTHGYSGGPISNQIHIWRYPSMTQVATLTGHTMRVLYLAMSPDGQTIVTGAGDETLRFWNAFNRAPGKKSVGGGVSGGAGGGDGNPFLQLR